MRSSGPGVRRRTLLRSAAALTVAALVAALLILATAASACSGPGLAQSRGSSDAARAHDAPRRDRSHTQDEAGEAGEEAAHEPRVDAREAEAQTDAGVPVLTALSVTLPPPDASTSLDGGGADGAGLDSGGTDTGGTDASLPSLLVPAFSPDVHDYYVRCTAGPNQLLVSLTTSPGSVGAVVLPVPSPSLPSQSFALTVYENEAIVAVATDRTVTTEYWVRCLPHDMPVMSWTVNPEAGPPTPGYYLVGNDFPPKTAPGYAMVLDTNGVPVWYAPAAKGSGVFGVDNLVPGTISFVQYTQATSTTADAFELHAIRPAATTYLAAAGFPPDVHELRLSKAGNYLAFSTPMTLGVDLTGLRVGTPGGVKTLGPDMAILDCAVVEFTATGAVVTAWMASDHFEAKLDSTYPELAAATAPDGGEVIDVFHCNSIDVDTATGNLLVSSRNMDSVFYVAWPAGTVLWKLGGKKASKDNATYVSLKDPFYRQHDARLLTWTQGCNGGTGQLSMFDDETVKPAPSRAVIYDVVVGGPDGGLPADSGSCDGGFGEGGFGDGGAPGSAVVSWQALGWSDSEAAGSFRISKDGSRVIAWGIAAVPGPIASEVDLSGNHLFDLRFVSNGTYRAVKVPLSAFNLEDLRNSAGAP